MLKGRKESRIFNNGNCGCQDWKGARNWESYQVFGNVIRLQIVELYFEIAENNQYRMFPKLHFAVSEKCHK